MVFLTLLILIANILIATDVARIFGMRRVSFALMMSPGILIALYAVLFNLLGIFNLITFRTLFTFEILFIGGYLISRSQAMASLVRKLYQHLYVNRLYLLIIFSLLLLTLLSAILLPPNNQDSMSYHLARVVHWMQNHNIDYYFTNVDRQNRMGPGAEILILCLQLLSSSDTLANLVQYLAFLFLCISMPDLLRWVGIRKNNAMLLSIFVISTPMLVLQAATTQNDILAGIQTWTIMLCLLTIYCKGFENVPGRFFVLAGITFGSAFLVKPTSIMLLLPLIAFVGMGYLFRFRTTLRAMVVRTGIVLLFFLFVAGPDLYRKMTDSKGQKVSFNDVFYPVTSEWSSSRLFNVLLAGMHHSPYDYDANAKFIKHTAGLMRATYNESSIKTNWNFYPHEDYAGNPFHFIAFLLSTVLSIFLLVILPFKRRYLLSLLPITSFLLFSLFLRDNPWISRLQLPFFLLIPLSFIPLEGIQGTYFTFSYRLVSYIFSFLCLGLAYVTVAQNVQRPLSISSLLNPDYSLGDLNNIYYLTSKDLKADHDKVIRLCEENNFKTVGVISGPGFHEYPLSWRLYQRGVRLIHVTAEDPQNADLIFAEDPTSLEAEEKYLRAGEKIYMKREPITTLSKQDTIDFPIESLILSDNATIRTESIFFYGNGTISTQSILFSQGRYSLIVKSSGADVAGQGSHWTIYIGNKSIGEINSAAPNQIDTLDFEIDSVGSYELRMEFDNDIFDPQRGLDRNGEVQHVAIHRN